MSQWARSQAKEPPFEPQSSVATTTISAYPSSFWDGSILLDPEATPNLFLKHDLFTPKLDAIYGWLWLSGLNRHSRSLHRQRLLQRTIQITECTDEHLVWYKNNIFIKPMPGYLLDYKHWKEFLCPDEQLFASATGLLLSYVWLVASNTDFAIATEERIFPPAVTWEVWRNIVHDMLRKMDTVVAQADRRYQYGELRLSRLNTLYRFNIATFSSRNFVHGFMSTPTWYTQFFETNFSWILAAFIYFTVILSAMQVGLATSQLQENMQFHNLSYGVFEEKHGEAKHNAEEYLNCAR
ncbi:hypothetical protein HBH42_093340 [Parastagonospora nodorum]|nr:hypothetical protein HBH42_093340 [Parastagonospora nodorum]